MILKPIVHSDSLCHPQLLLDGPPLFNIILLWLTGADSLSLTTSRYVFMVILLTIERNLQQVQDMHIHGCLYTGNDKPCQVLVPTWCVRPLREIGPRFPYSESILDGAQIQPFICDIIIDIKEGRQTYSFRVSYKKHCQLPECPFLHFWGSMVIMQVAAFEPDSVINMRDQDTILSDFMIKEYVFSFDIPKVSPHKGLSILISWVRERRCQPSHISLTK